MGIENSIIEAVRTCICEAMDIPLSSKGSLQLTIKPIDIYRNMYKNALIDIDDLELEKLEAMLYLLTETEITTKLDISQVTILEIAEFVSQHRKNNFITADELKRVDRDWGYFVGCNAIFQ